MTSETERIKEILSSTGSEIYKQIGIYLHELDFTTDILEEEGDYSELFAEHEDCQRIGIPTSQSSQLKQFIISRSELIIRDKSKSFLRKAQQLKQTLESQNTDFYNKIAILLFNFQVNVDDIQIVDDFYIFLSKDNLNKIGLKTAAKQKIALRKVLQIISSVQQIDLSIFRKTQPSVYCKMDYKSCISIARLLSSLKYYTLLKPQQHQQNMYIFTHFMKDVYKQRVIDDFRHLKQTHSHQLQEIMKFASEHYHYNECALDECDFASRHYRIEGRDNNDKIDDGSDMDPQFIFYADIMDSAHYFLQHLYHAGMRINVTIQHGQDEKEDVKCDEDEWFDKEFAKRKNILTDIQKSTQRFSRVSSNLSGKFNITPDQHQLMTIHDAEEGVTYMDSVYDYLSHLNVKDEEIKRLNKYVLDEWFDTEAVDIDIQINNGRGNISEYMKNQKIMDGIISRFNQSRRMYLELSFSHIFAHIMFVITYIFSIVSKGIFSIGLNYDYWSKYEDKKEQIRNEMYVEKKYDNFQQEIYEYQHEMSVKTFKNEVLVKAGEYLQSAAVKSTRCRVDWYDSEKYPFGISEGSIISKHHLISIILYTDYTNLSGAFSCSFRKNGPFETLQSAKKRNQNYFWWSKSLKEAVCVYGDAYYIRRVNEVEYEIDGWRATWSFSAVDLIVYGQEKLRHNNDRAVGKLRGPFYCGMSVVMNIPEFNITFLSPTSTSLHIEVAMKFSGDSGMIIEANNNKVGVTTQALDVSWISRYPEEEERYGYLSLY